MRIEPESEAAGVATDRIVTATPKLRTGAKTATDCSLHHWAVARGAMRRVERSLVGSCMDGLSDPPPDPAHQFAQDDHPAAEKDDYRPSLPDQSIDELVQLRIGHAQICCEFRATTGANRFVQVKTWTNVPSLYVASKSGGAPPHSKTQAEITASRMAATFWSAAVFCRC